MELEGSRTGKKKKKRESLAHGDIKNHGTKEGKLSREEKEAKNCSCLRRYRGIVKEMEKEQPAG